MLRAPPARPVDAGFFACVPKHAEKCGKQKTPGPSGHRGSFSAEND